MPKTTILYLLKNPKIFAEKEKSAVLVSNSVFHLSDGRDINFKKHDILFGK